MAACVEKKALLSKEEEKKKQNGAGPRKGNRTHAPATIEGQRVHFKDKDDDEVVFERPQGKDFVIYRMKGEVREKKALVCLSDDGRFIVIRPTEGGKERRVEPSPQGPDAKKILNAVEMPYAPVSAQGQRVQFKDKDDDEVVLERPQGKDFVIYRMKGEVREKKALVRMSIDGQFIVIRPVEGGKERRVRPSPQGPRAKKILEDFNKERIPQKRQSTPAQIPQKRRRTSIPTSRDGHHDQQDDSDEDDDEVDSDEDDEDDSEGGDEEAGEGKEDDEEYDSELDTISSLDEEDGSEGDDSEEDEEGEEDEDEESVAE